MPKIYMKHSYQFANLQLQYGYSEETIGVIYIEYKKSYLEKVVNDRMEMDKHNNYTLYDHGQVIWEYNGKTED